jgi:hypothetical protein
MYKQSCPQCPFFLNMAFRRRGGREGSGYLAGKSAKKLLGVNIQTAARKKKSPAWGEGLNFFALSYKIF